LGSIARLVQDRNRMIQASLIERWMGLQDRGKCCFSRSKLKHPHLANATIKSGNGCSVERQRGR
jgi:hypothetical protein